MSCAIRPGHKSNNLQVHTLIGTSSAALWLQVLVLTQNSLEAQGKTDILAQSMQGTLTLGF